VRSWAFGTLAALGLLARLLLAWKSPGGLDVQSYSTVVAAASRGEGIYGTSVYNYSPLWAGVILLVDGAARAAGVSFGALVRTLLAVVDLVSAAALGKLAVRRGIDPWKVAAIFLANPVSIWVTGFQGQFDGLSLLFLLLAILGTPTRAAGSPHAGSARPMLFLALSIAVKQITLFHPILWFERVRNRTALLVPWVLTAALFVPFLREWRAIRDRVLFYRGVPRSYGLSELILFDERFALPVGIVCFAAGLFAAWRLRKEPDLVRASRVQFLVLLFFAPGFGTQYAVWPLTVGALTGGMGYFLCTATTMAWTLGSHFGVPGSGRWMGQLVWLSVALWLLLEVRGLMRSRALAAGVGRA
jgi:hypothetical protein